MVPSVAVLGGGIGGLSAAHELAERGFDVDVYEKRWTFGGKARSLDVPDSAEPGTKPLPAEHGFRFFPAFYRHTFDTMRRIPYGDNEEGVYDNLSVANQCVVAQRGEAEAVVPLELPEIVENWDDTMELFVENPLDIPREEATVFADQMLTFLTACRERREEEYDQVSWWEFIRAEEMSEEYKLFFGYGSTRTLVAMRPHESSARTIATITIQLTLGLAMPWLHADQLLDGPTNEVWIDPWVEYLDQHGVVFHPGATVESIQMADGNVSSVTIREGDSTHEVTADAYVAAVPVEVMRELVTHEMVAAAPALGDIEKLDTEWMNGIQFYLDERMPISDGHVRYLASPWALTSISQGQFWEADLADYGPEEVRDILSVCISNWGTDGELVEKPARECTPAEIKREVWFQITDRLDTRGEDLSEDHIVTWYLDPGIEFPAPNETTNAEPLLINTVGSLQYRPEAVTDVPNLYLAADYVRTNTDLATMESANEAARRAVNGIIEATGSDADPCEVWELDEPAVFTPLKMYDRLRYEMDRPHQDT